MLLLVKVGSRVATDWASDADEGCSVRVESIMLSSYLARWDVVRVHMPLGCTFTAIGSSPTRVCCGLTS